MFCTRLGIGYRMESSVAFMMGFIIRYSLIISDFGWIHLADGLSGCIYCIDAPFFVRSSVHLTPNTPFSSHFPLLPTLLPLYALFLPTNRYSPPSTGPLASPPRLIPRRPQNQFFFLRNQSPRTIRYHQ
ncbi:hypothetical protein JAAARDRAFT_696905 [Jaapia argillacea MUCL 33604]|uniref:Uncharacterized protein n=1 Tax=Jaapia argillacea MUCL 33604 TaxID=933084 RepID=A0A067PLD1_9AGAM|nr:hypothetical protein JAAARDRAFT_696905 [Jaapia argillacea MUCL 33604]